MRRVVSFLPLFLVLVQVGCAPAIAPSLRILFVGNSYTFYNGGIDRVLTDMAAQRGKTIECRTATSPGRSLEWHYSNGPARAMITGSKWDFVVLQDYSTQALEHPDLLVSYVRNFDALIKPTGARTVLFMTWPRENQPDSLRVIGDAYMGIARQIGAGVVPVGLAWQQSRLTSGRLNLYRADQAHPNAEGTYLAVCCFYAMLLNDDPRGLSPPLMFEELSLPRRITPETARFLQEIAWQTCRPN